ncbi:hypothetical protein AA0116_g11422 [Alternaria tenuissima]|nr:hypothetical protein AA0116_g11422 [Alternaria tenuissima]
MREICGYSAVYKSPSRTPQLLSHQHPLVHPVLLPTSLLYIDVTSARKRNTYHSLYLCRFLLYISPSEPQLFS